MKNKYFEEMDNVRYEKKDELISLLKQKNNEQITERATARKKRPLWLKYALSAAASFVLVFSIVFASVIAPNLKDGANSSPGGNTDNGQIFAALSLDSVGISPSISVENESSAYESGNNSEYYVFQLTADLTRIDFTQKKPVLYVERTVDGVCYGREYSFNSVISEALSVAKFDKSGNGRKTVYFVFEVSNEVYKSFNGLSGTSQWGAETISRGNDITIVCPAGTAGSEELVLSSSFTSVDYFDNLNY